MSDSIEYEQLCAERHLDVSAGSRGEFRIVRAKLLDCLVPLQIGTPAVGDYSTDLMGQ